MPPIGLAVSAGLSLQHLFEQPEDTPGPAVLVSAASTPTHPSVPPGEADQAHRALHRLGEACADHQHRSQATIDREVEALLGFARRHPRGGFQIDDEHGTSLSLLLVLREELASCDPAALPQVETLLPPRFRSAAPPS